MKHFFLTLIGLFFIAFNVASQSSHNRTLMGYWHNWGPEYRLTDIPDDYNVIVIAFASTSFNGTNSFTPNYDVTNFKADITTIQSEGKKVLISIGGEGGSFTLSSTTDKSNFVQSMIAMVEEYNFDGLDVDLEGSAIKAIGDADFKNPTTATSVNFLDAIDEVLTHFGSEFVLAAVPESFYVQRAYQGLESDKGAFLPFLHRFHDRIDLLGVQLYNTGGEYALDNGLYSSGTTDFLVSQTHMLIHGIPVGGFQSTWDDKEWLAGFDPSQILIGVPSSISAAGSGQVTDLELNAALDALIFGKKTEGAYDLVPDAGHANLGGLMTWSINWDKDDRNYGFANNFTTYFNAISTVNFSPLVDFGVTEVGRKYTKDYSITNLSANDEVITFSGIPSNFSVSENDFTVKTGETKTIQIEFEPQSLGTFNVTMNLELSISENAVIDISSEVGCFTSHGISDDFNKGLSDNWIEGEEIKLSVVDQQLVVDANKVDGLWVGFNINFPSADLSNDSKISFDLSCDKDVNLRLELVNAAGKVTNLNATNDNLAIYKYGTDGSPQHFEMEFKDIFKQFWPDQLDVDPSNMVGISFLPNQGEAFTGVMTIDNLVIGDDSRLEYPAEASICENETFSFGTQTLTADNEGMNNELFTSSIGCDSLVVLNLIINQSTISTDVQTSCTALTWIDGNTYMASNNTATFNQVGGGANGCDNLVTLDFTYTGTMSTDVQIACDSYTWIDGITYTESNNTATFYQVGTGPDDCDDLVTLDLTINNSTTSTDVQSACESYIWIDGNTYTESNNTATFNQVGANPSGCDNLVTLDLTINNSTTSTDVQLACESYIWIDGNTYTESNNTATFNQVGANSGGCDNLVTLDLTINNSTTSTDVQSACESYIWIDGNTYTESNNTATFNEVGVSTDGCDNLVTLDLTIHTADAIDASVTATDLSITASASSASYQWIDCNNNNAIIDEATGQTFTASSNGDYAVIVTENGCSVTSDCITITEVVTGIEDGLPSSAISLYPNPSKEYFKLDLDNESKNVLVTVFNTAGIQVIQKRFEQLNGEITISTKSLIRGVYLVSIYVNDSNVIRKLIIE
jgi:chitinase